MARSGPRRQPARNAGTGTTVPLAPAPFYATKQIIPEIARHLRLKQDGQIFCTLVDAIERAMGYRNEHVFPRGQVAARDVDPDGKEAAEFRREFTDVVSWFLEGHPRAAEFFFPTILPDTPSWDGKTSRTRLKRLKWEDDKETICGGVGLLFEYLKANNDFDLHKDMEFDRSFDWVGGDNGPCEGCGRNREEGNEIFYCRYCHTGHHQQCKGPKVITPEPWTCQACRGARKPSSESATSRTSASQSPGNTSQTAKSPSRKRSRTSDPIPQGPTSPLSSGESEVPSLNESLSPEEREHTGLIVSVDGDTARMVPLDTIKEARDLYIECAEAWDLEPISSLHYLVPGHSLKVELDLNNSKHFASFMKVILGEWRANKGVGHVYIEVFIEYQGAVEVSLQDGDGNGDADEDENEDDDDDE